MARSRFPAVPAFLALASGACLSMAGLWWPVPAGVLVLGLCFALRGLLGTTIGWLALGLTLGGIDQDVPAQPHLDRPVEVGLDLKGQWERDENGLRSRARVRWLRQGLMVSAWHQTLSLVLPRDAKPPPGSSLRVRGFMRRSAAPANGTSSRPGPWVLRIKSGVFVETEKSARDHFSSLFMSVGEALRRRIRPSLCDLEQSEGRMAASLVGVFVLGQSRDLPSEVQRGLRGAGLAHLTALSGLHVGLLMGGVMVLFAAAPVRLRLLSALALVCFYLVLAGPRPSLVRATLMIMALMWAWLIRRSPQPLNALAWVGGAMILFEYQLVADRGFQLTVVATAGIILLAPRLERKWTHLPEIVRKPLAVSVAAHLAVLPWTLSAFRLATLWAPLWNLLMVPWAAVSLTLSFGWTLASLLSLPCAKLFGVFLGLIAAPLSLFGSLPPKILGCMPVGVGWAVALATAFALMCLFLGRGWPRRFAGSALVVGALLRLQSGATDPELILLDVGQGEAILLRDRGKALLIDGGGWRRSDISQKILLPALTGFGVQKLEGMILSHPDTDHCEGLLTLASNMKVERLYLSPGWSDDPCALNLITRAGIEVRSLWKGESIKLGRWSLQAVHPRAGDRLGRNNRSLVLLGKTNGQNVLLTGDLEAAGEDQVIAALTSQGTDRIDILKIGHHGSNTSTTARFLEQTKPRLALISSGVGNRYGHPDPRVLARIRERRIPTLRTDRVGAVRIAFGPGDQLHILLPGQPRDRGL